MRKTLIFASLAAFAALGACNTVEGAAKDVKSVGESGEKTVKKVGDNL